LSGLQSSGFQLIANLVDDVIEGTASLGWCEGYGSLSHMADPFRGRLFKM
jgi:hypothetical protein